MILLSNYLRINVAVGKPLVITPANDGIVIEPFSTYFIDTTTGIVELYLPQNPVLNQSVEFFDSKNNWGVNKFVLHRVPIGGTPTSNNNIYVGDGPYNESLECDVSRFNFKLKYGGSGWLLA
jgi:hypothetical protein